MTVNGPHVSQGNLAIMDRLVLIKHRLGRIYREDELLLIEQESRPELVFTPSIVRINLGIVLPLKYGTNDREVANGNVGGGVRCIFIRAMYADKPQVVQGRHRE